MRTKNSPWGETWGRLWGDSWLVQPKNATPASPVIDVAKASHGDTGTFGEELGQGVNISRVNDIDVQGNG